YVAGELEIERPLLLRHRHHEGGEALARTSPIPAAILREGAEVLLQYDAPILEHDEGFTVALLQEVVERRYLVHAPAEFGRVRLFPGNAEEGREVEILGGQGARQ